MSTPRTHALQRARLAGLGLRTADLPELQDVDTIEDARAVARSAPAGRFAAALRTSGHLADDEQPMPEAPARGRIERPDRSR